MEDSKVASYLAEHPRMIGVLATALLLLSQAGNAVAGGTSSVAGP
ncbi:MAG: hypothetical protein ACI8XM_002051 [Haloarculaceae archaeon]|jgi:hypothetical protein